jgi:hypothetical protein
MEIPVKEDVVPSVSQPDRQSSGSGTTLFQFWKVNVKTLRVFQTPQDVAGLQWSFSVLEWFHFYSHQ